MRLGILGRGRVGQAIARRGYAAGYDIRIGTRAPEEGVAITPGDFRLQSYEDAVRGADVVFLALPWPASLDVARAVAPILKPSAPLVDATRPPDALGLTQLPAASAAERIAAAIAPVPVVKALNHLSVAELEAPPVADRPLIVFYCGTAGKPKILVSRVLQRLGFCPIDAGGLSTARSLEGSADLFDELSRRLNRHD